MTATTTTPAETIHAKLEAACASVRAARTYLAKVVAANDSAANLVPALISLADAEGQRDLWARLSQAAQYHAREGRELEKVTAMELVVSMLSQGAEDTYSGRTNDVRRAHFDGVRSAAREVEWIY